MSDVRCGLCSQIDNICAVVIPSFNSLAVAHPAPRHVPMTFSKPRVRNSPKRRLLTLLPPHCHQ